MVSYEDSAGKLVDPLYMTRWWGIMGSESWEFVRITRIGCTVKVSGGFGLSGGGERSQAGES